MIFISGITIAVFFEILLILKKPKSHQDKVLIVWMFLIIIHMVLFYLNYTEINLIYPFLLGVELPMPLVHGPMLFLYVAVSTKHQFWSIRLQLIHFIPIILLYVYLISFFSLPASEKIFVFKNNGSGYEGFLTLLFYLYIFYTTIYLISSILLLRTHRKKIVNQYSTLEKVNLNWLRILIIGMGIIWFVTIFMRNEIYNFSSVVLFIFLVGLFGRRQIGISISESQNNPDKSKYVKSGLKKDNAAELKEKLLNLMNDEKPYKKNELVIGDLAEKLNVHYNYLSQLINEELGLTFYEFINQYRIEEFKRLVSLPENKQFTFLALAYECGFNSKSSFNRYFKDSTGQTPSQYLSGLKRD